MAKAQSRIDSLEACIEALVKKRRDAAQARRSEEVSAFQLQIEAIKRAIEDEASLGDDPDSDTPPGRLILPPKLPIGTV